MCGIVGYVGSRSAVDVLIQGLKLLEYRGYDSAGLALVLNEKIEIKKSEGRLDNVLKLIDEHGDFYRKAFCGIGHTRWATHGKPTTQNAHPHQAGHVVLVHNGIIENYLEIKKTLLSKGYAPLSETDSELLGFLIMDEMEHGASLVDGVRRAFTRIHGQCSVVVMSEREPGVIVAVRDGSPLVAALDPEGGVIVASDAQALVALTRQVLFLEQGDLLVGTSEGMKLFNLATGSAVERSFEELTWSYEKLDKGGYPHYMLKEIHEQPIALVDTMNWLLDRGKSEDPFPFAEQPAVKILDAASELILVACGTSWHAALLGRYWIEKLAKFPVSVELASEFRYRDPVVRPGAVVIGISQSGETADTLAVLKEMKKLKVATLAISNVRGSTMSREVDGMLYTSAGPEIGVAATKTFLAQLLVLFLIAGHLGFKRKPNSAADLFKIFEDVVKLPHLIELEIAEGSPINQLTLQIAKSVSGVKGFFFMGRGYSFPIALEAALKVKEIAYDHAEGYAAGELKHGPIAMIDEQMVVVVLAPNDSWREKTVSNLQEVKARGATVIGVGNSGDLALSQLCDYWVPLPPEVQSLDPSLWPFVLTPVVQLLSYHRAVVKGTDVDRPRNLAKSVTVE